jgi:hypothetical protein
MVHLLSQTPIQCRPPVAQSQLAHRENTSSESLHDATTVVTTTVIPTRELEDGNSYIPVPTQAGSQNVQTQTISPSAIQMPTQFNSFNPPPNFQPQQSQVIQSSVPSSAPYASPFQPRKTTSFGYNPSTAENFIPLSSLPSKTHGDHIGISSMNFLTQTASQSSNLHSPSDKLVVSVNQRGISISSTHLKLVG